MAAPVCGAVQADSELSKAMRITRAARIRMAVIMEWFSRIGLFVVPGERFAQPVEHSGVPGEIERGPGQRGQGNLSVD